MSMICPIPTRHPIVVGLLREEEHHTEIEEMREKHSKEMNAALEQIRCLAAQVSKLNADFALREATPQSREDHVDARERALAEATPSIAGKKVIHVPATTSTPASTPPPVDTATPAINKRTPAPSTVNKRTPAIVTPLLVNSATPASMPPSTIIKPPPASTTTPASMATPATSATTISSDEGFFEFCSRVATAFAQDVIKVAAECCYSKKG